MTALAPVLQGFFIGHLAQRRASSHTVASYRDCFRLLLCFTQARTGKTPATLQLADLDAELIGAFLDHLERDRHNGIQTRNLRLTAIHSLFTYAALRCPEQAELISRDRNSGATVCREARRSRAERRGCLLGGVGSGGVAQALGVRHVVRMSSTVARTRSRASARSMPFMSSVS